MLTTREEAARRAVTDFKMYCTINHHGEDLVYRYFLASITPSGEDTSAEALRNDGLLTKEQFDEAIKLRKAFFELFDAKRLLFFADVDNTVTQRGKLSEQKKIFFKNWELSDRVVLSTGKIYKSIEQTARALGLEKNPCCCLNGAVLYDGKGGEKIVAALGERARMAAEFIAKKGLSYVLYYPDALRVETSLKQKDIENLVKYDEMFLDTQGETDYKRVVKLLAFVDEGDAEQEAIVDEAARLINLKALRTAPHSYEIVSPDTDKGVALKATAKLFGTHFRMTAAIGDSMNDLPMLNACGLPYIVSDASESLAKYGFPAAEKNRDVDLPELFTALAQGKL